MVVEEPGASSNIAASAGEVAARRLRCCACRHRHHHQSVAKLASIRWGLLPVASVAPTFMLSTHPDVPAKTFQEFVDYARKTKPPLPYASGGNGSQHQLMMEMLKQRADIDLLHVPFRGAAPATQATVAGDTKVLFSGSASASLIRKGALRVLAASGQARCATRTHLIGEFYPALRSTSGLESLPSEHPGRSHHAPHRDSEALAPAGLRRETQRLGQPRAVDPSPAEFEARPRGLRKVRNRA